MSRLPAGQRRQRLSAPQRRESIVEAATRVFARGSYGGTTTAQIAREADANESLLYRHFGSKRELYLACIDGAWGTIRQSADEAMAAADVSLHWRVLGATFLDLSRDRPQVARLWLQALTETTSDEEIDARLVEVMREAHAYATEVLARSQAAGGIAAGRQPRSEAWIIIALGLLGTIGLRLGDVVRADFDGVLAAHREWLTGSAS